MTLLFKNHIFKKSILEEYLPDVFALEMYHLFMELCVSLSIITLQTSSRLTSAMSAFPILLMASVKFPSSLSTLTRWHPCMDDQKDKKIFWNLVFNQRGGEVVSENKYIGITCTCVWCFLFS